MVTQANMAKAKKTTKKKSSATAVLKMNSEKSLRPKGPARGTGKPQPVTSKSNQSRQPGKTSKIVKSEKTIKELKTKSKPIKSKKVVAEIVSDEDLSNETDSVHPLIEEENIKDELHPADLTINVLDSDNLGSDSLSSDSLSSNPIRSAKKKLLKKSATPALIESSSKAISTTDPVQLYLNEIKKYPLLTREQEQELAKKYYETKDPQIAQVLVTSNLRFVVKVAAEYSKFGSKMIDLIQEGNMGLMHAVRDFNPYKGVRLITYAVWWIRGYIMEYLMKQYSLVKIGTTQNQKKLFYQLQKEKEALDALGDSPNLALISSRLGIPEDEVKDMANRLSGRDVSLNAPLDDESKSTLMDVHSADLELPDESLSKKENVGHLSEAIESVRPFLNEKEKIILEERLLSDEPLTLQEIGEKYKITREAVRQAEARLMKKIKDEFFKKESSDT